MFDRPTPTRRTAGQSRANCIVFAGVVAPDDLSFPSIVIPHGIKYQEKNLLAHPNESIDYILIDLEHLSLENWHRNFKTLIHANVLRFKTTMSL